MAADGLEPLASLLQRQSVPALRLREPGPSATQLESAFETALRAPDHNGLKPWRFLVIEGAARQALSELFVSRWRARDPQAPQNKLEKARAMPLTAPLVIAVAGRIIQGHKVPEAEQVLSVGAAVMNLLNALHAHGFGAVWLTGPNAYDAGIAAALGWQSDERPYGFVYVGTPAEPSATPRRTAPERFVRRWQP